MYDRFLYTGTDNSYDFILKTLIICFICIIQIIKIMNNRKK